MLKTNKPWTRALSTALALCMLLSLLPVSVLAVQREATTETQSDAYYSVISQKNYKVSPGITEKEIILNNSTGTDQNVCHVLEADLSNPYVTVMPSYKDMKLDSWDTPMAESDWGNQVMSKQVAAAEALGYNVVGATNINLSWASNNPPGMLVINGKVYHDDTAYGNNYLVIDRSGKASIRPGSQPLDGSELHAISAWSYIVRDGVSLYPAEDHATGSRAPRTVLGLKADGSLVLMVNDGRQQPVSSGMSINELATMMIELGCTDVLNCDGGGSSTFITKREGSDKATIKNTPSDGAERPTLTGLLLISTAKPSGEFDHAALLPGNEIYTPGTEIQFTATGVDSGGYNVALPEDVTFALSEDSAGMGAIDAATGLFSAAADAEGIVTVQALRGGAVVGSTSIELAKPDSIYFNTAEISLGFNDSTDFGVEVKNKGRDVNYKAGDLVWTLSDERLGTFDGNIFTSSEGESLNGTVTVSSAFDSSITASINLIVGKLPTLVFDFEDYTDPETGAVTPAKEYYTIGSKGDGSYFFTSNYGKGGVQSAEIVSIDDDEPVRFGSHALKLNFDFSACTNVTEGACVGTSDEIAIPGMPTAIGVWVYAPEGVGVKWEGDGTTAGLWLRGYVTDGNGGNQAYDFTFEPKVFGSDKSTWPDEYPGVWWEGWRYLEADLTKFTGPFTIKAGMTFRLMYVYGTKMMGTKTAGSIYFDNMQFVYGANVDDVDNPVISSVTVDKEPLKDGAVLTNSVLNFAAQQYDVYNSYTSGLDTVRMFIDGINTYDNDAYDFQTIATCEEAYLSNVRLTNGTHSLTTTVRDKAGNETSETIYFTVDAPDNAAAAVTVTPDAAAAVLGQEISLEIRGSQASSVSTALKLSKLFPDYTVEFSDSYEGSYAYKSFTGVVSIDAQLKAGAQPSDLIATVKFHVPAELRQSDVFSYTVKSCRYELADQSTGSFSTREITVPVAAYYTITADPIIVGLGGTLCVQDSHGLPAANVPVYLADNSLLGTTDGQGRLTTDRFSTAAGTYSVYAKDAAGNISFQYDVLSYDAVGEGQLPFDILNNAAKDGSTQKNISWLSSAADSQQQLLQYAPVNGGSWTTLRAASQIRTFTSGGNQAVMANSVTVSGLTAGQTYRYRVGRDGAWSEEKTFTLNGPDSLNFFVLGDIQAKDLTNITALTDVICRSNYALGIQTGDAVDDASRLSYWREMAGVLGTDKFGGVDILHVLGNHEYAGDGDGAAAAAIYNLPDSGPGSHYSVTYGDVYFAVINYTGTKSQLREALDWLKKDAAQSSAEWKVLCMHQPSYYTNITGGNAEINEMVPGVLDEVGIDFVFSGHDHSYARTEPLKGGAVDEENGIVYFICGSSGEKSYAVTDNPDFHFAVATQEFNAVYLSVSADNDRFSVTTYDVQADGTTKILDTYTKEKPRCANDEHTLVYDRSTGKLSCSQCSYVRSAKDILYSGWAADSETGRQMYFVAGQYQTGYINLNGVFYLFDGNGLTYEGEYVIGGETCLFETGRFVSCSTADIHLAGRAGNNCDFVLYRDGRMVISGSGDMYGYGTSGNNPWYTLRHSIKRVFIGKDITSIGAMSFRGATNCAEVIFEEGSQLRLLGSQAFHYNSSLVSVKLPDTVIALKGSAFGYCGRLRDVYIPEGVSSMTKTTFQETPNVVLSVAAGSYAEDYAKQYGIQYTTREVPVLPLYSGSCGADAAWALYGDGRMVISGSGAMYDYASQMVTPWADYRHAITAIEIGAEITHIGNCAFKGTTACTEIVFAEGSRLRTIGSQAFHYNSALTSVRLPDTVSVLKGSAFGYCARLRDVYIPDGMSSMTKNTFQQSPNVVLSVAADSYAEDYAKQYGIPYTTREMPVLPLYSGSCGANATWALYGDGRMVIGGSGAMYDYASQLLTPWADYRHTITAIEIGAGITHIGNCTFKGATACSEIVFAEGSQLKTIGSQAFHYNSALASVRLPDTVTVLKGSAFGYCANLRDVYIPDGVFSMTKTTFQQSPNVTLNVAAGSYAESFAKQYGIPYTVRQAPVTPLYSGSCGANAAWALYSDGRMFISGSGAMDDYASQLVTPWADYRHTITAIEIGAGITHIGNYAFKGATNCKEVVFAEGSQLKTIGSQAFHYNSALTSVRLPDTVTVLKGSAFGYCANLRDVYIPDGVFSMTKTTFQQSPNAVLNVAAGSYAENYAKQYGIPYTTR